uniref:Uncharacterized protein n=1 Tax=Rhizophora mucronata TaxID=61149 RepID=A0A2P2J497_RHIMU
MPLICSQTCFDCCGCHIVDILFAGSSKKFIHSCLYIFPLLFTFNYCISNTAVNFVCFVCC